MWDQAADLYCLGCCLLYLSVIERRIKNTYTDKKRDFPYYQPLAANAGGFAVDAWLFSFWLFCFVFGWLFLFCFFFFLTEVASSSSILNNPYDINDVSTFGFSGIQ